jgi:Outer membrane protein beta-barrel domain
MVRWMPSLLVRSLFALSIVAMTANDARAQWNGSVEAFLGHYEPSVTDEADGELSWGVRGGYRLVPRAGFELMVERLTSSEDAFKLVLTNLDLSGKVYLNPDARAELYLLGGPGWAFVNLEFGGRSAQIADSLTAHAGVGVEVALWETFYLRPEVRARWYEKSETDDLEIEGSLALGLRF